MRAFFDTSLAVYALAPDGPARSHTAQQLFGRHGSDHSLVVSTQVLMETYRVLTRKKRVLPADALAVVQWLARQAWWRRAATPHGGRLSWPGSTGWAPGMH